MRARLAVLSMCHTRAGLTRYRESPFVTGPPHLRFYAGAPLVASNGYRLGSMCEAVHMLQACPSASSSRGRGGCTCYHAGLASSSSSSPRLAW